MLGGNEEGAAEDNPGVALRRAVGAQRLEGKGFSCKFGAH